MTPENSPRAQLSPPEPGRPARAPSPGVPGQNALALMTFFPSRETNNLTHAHHLQKGISGDRHFKEKEGSLKRDCAESSRPQGILQAYAGPFLQTTLQLVKSNRGALEPHFQEPEYGTHCKFGQILADGYFFYESSIQKLYSTPGKFSLTRTRGAMGPRHQ